MLLPASALTRATKDWNPITQADSLLSTPRTNSAIQSQLAAQERKPQTALKLLATLRQKATVEIERLLAFLDALDPYVQNDLPWPTWVRTRCLQAYRDNIQHTVRYTELSPDRFKDF